jgi:phenylacetate-CoA ligase
MSTAGSAGQRHIEVSIIVPCLNEGENVLELAHRAQVMFDAAGISGEVVFVNDGSTDHTGQLIDGLAAQSDLVRGVHHPTNMGIPAGWQSGVQAARGRYVCIMDGDMQNLPEDVARLYRQIKYTNADVVQGHRSHIGRARDFRYVMSRVLHHMLRVMFPLEVSDIKSGFLICDRDVFAHLLRHRFSYYYFQNFPAVSAHHKGYRVEDIETLFEERRLGKSFIAAFPWKMILKNLVDLAKGLVEFRLLSTRVDALSDTLAVHTPTRRAQPRSLLPRVHERLFAAAMPLHHWKLSSGALHYLDQLRETQWLPSTAIRAMQEARLRALIKHAYRHVSYYRDRFDRVGVDPSEIQRLEDLQRLPVLTKDIIRKNLHFDLLSDAHDKLQMLPLTTSGVAGEPLTTYADRTQLEMRWAIAERNREWTGYQFGGRSLVLRSTLPSPNRLQRARDWLDAALSRRIVFPMTEFTSTRVRELLALVRQRRPALIEGDAEILQVMAEAAEGGNGDLLVAAIASSGQALSPRIRAAIEAAFGAAVFDSYATTELGTVAHECEQHRGYHVNAESYIVEIVCDGRPARPGETGDVLITDLTNLSVPLIRYAIGDRATAVAQDCPCGRGLPLIGAIEGRQPSIIAGSDGTMVTGTFFAEVLKDYGYLIRQFRVVQHQPGAADLSIVRGPRFSEKALEELLPLFRRHLGANFVLNVHIVDQIDDVASQPRAVGA